MGGGSRAGQAPEAGSVHRRGVAAFLAAAGLAGRGLPCAGHSVDGPFPTRLEFETDQPTDDIGCHMSDGSRMYLSAKRACGNDKYLKGTVEQWAAQAGMLNDGDRLVLATAEPRGIVRALGAALSRRRQGLENYSATERPALEVLIGLLAGRSQAVRDRVLDAAYVLKIDASEAGCPEFDLAAERLEGTIVSAGDGARSITVLSVAMHTEAGKAFASGIDDWIEVLQAAGIEVYADGQGPPGAAARARQSALEAHRAGLAGQDGVVDLSLLADDLTPLMVPGLADDLRVSVSGHGERPVETELLVLARRWPRMLLVGLPGAGKSTALRQVAARWARDSQAPVPVLVPLRAVARRCEYPAAVTLSVLCEAAARDVAAEQRTDLAVALESMCLEGRAVLLLDGLDECLDRRPVVAEGLRPLLNSLPAETGLILATRSSGLPAAGRLALPTAELMTPQGLDGVLRQLLRHVADARLAEPQRDAWVEARAEWLNETREAHRDLGSVPLLATLLALVAADSTDHQLPNGRANLLRTAVRNSVQRWESRRPIAGDDRQGWPTNDQLLDGYAVVGHRLAVSGEVGVQDATADVVAMLTDRWGLSAGAADELAERILWFWDVHVGVFVSTDTGALVPRSRVFAEIAAAMWAVRLSDELLADWVTACLPDPNWRVALQLATDLEPRVMTFLLTENEPATFEACTLLAAEAALGGAPVSPQQLESLLDRLATAASRALDDTTTNDNPQPAGSEPERPGAERRRADRDGPGWDYVRELARIRLPSHLRDQRRSRLNALALNDEQTTVAQALCALSDAAKDERPVTDTGEAAVRRLLALPLPERSRLRHESRRHVVVLGGPSLLSGHAEAAAAAATHLAKLDDDGARRIHDIVERSSLRTYGEAARTLAARGHRFEIAGWRNAASGLAGLAAAWYLEQELPLLQAAADLSASDLDMSEARRWRLPDLLDLCAVLDTENVEIGSLIAATTTDTDEMRRGWLQATAVAASLDVTAVAAQARLALGERGSSSVPAGNGTMIWKLMTAPPPCPRPQTEVTRLGTGEQYALVAALGATSDWIADSACHLLFGSRGERLRAQLLHALPALPPHRRRLTALLACSAADDPVEAATQILAQPDPAARAGATRALTLLSESNQQAQDLLDQAHTDDDLTIRLAARQGQQPAVTEPPPTRWSCQLCANYNAPADVDCHGCARGARPDD